MKLYKRIFWFKQIDWIAFASNILAVILGIAITFSIQALIDSKKEKDNVRSALELVKDELEGCKSDLEQAENLLNLEIKASKYIYNNRKDIKQCPQDSIRLYGPMLISTFNLTLPKDAFELLKTSSLFQSIGDNGLSLKIMKAYDQCSNTLELISKHEDEKRNALLNACKSNLIEEIFADETFHIATLVSSEEGLRALFVAKDNSPVITIKQSIQVMDSAINSIEDFL